MRITYIIIIYFNYKATGYVIADGNGVCIAVVVNGIKNVLWKFVPDIPRRMGRGNEAFRKNKDTKIDDYIELIIKKMNKFFITLEKFNVDNIVVGSFYAEIIITNDNLDGRINNMVGYDLESLYSCTI